MSVAWLDLPKFIKGFAAVGWVSRGQSTQAVGFVTFPVGLGILGHALDANRLDSFHLQSLARLPARQPGL